MQTPILRKYNETATILFDLIEADGVNFRVDAVYAAGDISVMIDEGVEVNTTNAFVDEGFGYSISLTPTEMTAKRIVLYIVDQSPTKLWLDKYIVIETYGNANAQHQFDLDSPNVTLAATTHVGAIIPNVTLVDTTSTNSDMRGTDGANTNAPDNTTIAAIAGYLDTEMTAVLLATQTTIPDLIAALNDITPGDILTTQLTESYAVLNAIPTLSQLLFEVRALLAEHSTTGVTKTVNQLDGITPAATYNYDDATNPTAISRNT